MPLFYNLDAERAVIGSVLIENDMFDVVDAILPSDAFYDPANERIYAALRELREEGEPIDFVLLTGRLGSADLAEIGGIGYLSRLASSVPSERNAAYYANEVKKTSLQRLGYKLIRDLHDSLLEGAAPDMIAAQLDQAAAIMLDHTAKGNDFKPMSEVMMDTYEQIESRAMSPRADGLTGVPSGYGDLDKMTAGFQRQDLIVVAARPSVGKTALALNIAQHAGIRAKANVAVFSLEMSDTQLGQRFLSAESNIDATRLRTGKLESDDWDKLTFGAGPLSESQIYLDDTPGISISEIRAKCRRLKKRLGRLDLILIDYLQLITLKGRRKENRQQEVAEISRILKQIARELDVPVVALSQLSRAVEQRQDKRPMMSDLRESGSIEQDADIVAFLYRDDYYDKETEKKNIIEIIIAKHRNGPVGTVELAFLKNFSKFVSLDRHHTS
ncbi:replicative DNA helicase [Paenibacillus sp. MWE-103]|uniref:Replicative DNA helicase n=1 Tax=Paenibacillus artemisiicola TaxID=1172618 RepID=A0ABS3WGF8_9BACL|nr:replicative DNA helicase [Paenibacillus artemisiicola]MBO7747375.1 replicative DNA helicase [Paenibacillus artemisiicola]